MTYAPSQREAWTATVSDKQALALDRYLISQIAEVEAGERLLSDSGLTGSAEADATIEIKNVGLFRIRVARGEVL